MNYSLILIKLLINLFLLVLTGANDIGLDALLRNIKPFVARHFAKWSAHKHNVANCKLTITVDGIWSMHRRRCMNDFSFFPTQEFGNLNTGCRESPMLKSYFCKAHQNEQLKFFDGESFIAYKAADVTLGKLSNNKINNRSF